MSHFCVMVIGDDAETQFIPFEESGAPEEYLTFRDDEDEHLKRYNTESTEKVIMPDGRMLNPFDEEFRVPGTMGTGGETHKVPDNLKKKEVPFKELYPTFEEFMSDWCGYKERDSKTLRYGYWENKNAKWDEHRLGGRWRGFFKLKPGRTGVLTDASWDSSKETLKGYADQALKGDIDFEAMMEEDGKKAQDRWERLERLCGGTIPKIDRSWDEVLKDDSIGDIDKKREFYHNQPALKKIKEISSALNKDRDHRKLEAQYKILTGDLQRLASDDMQPDTNAMLEKIDELRALILAEQDRSFMTWIELDAYQCSKEEFIYKARSSAISTFALLRDGKWYEKGEMGWWGMVSNEKDQKEWDNQFVTLISDLPDDTVLSVHDCHI